MSDFALASASDGLAAGTMVTPSIRLVRELGRGGMGSVWVAEHLRLHTQVVVKFIVQEHIRSPEVVARFEREAALAAQAKSPHVVQVFDHGIAENGLPYIAMELLEGEDLGSRLERGVIAPNVLCDWLSQACKGLARAHSKGIVHRDIKPENIFLTDNEGDVLVKILDFGIAKADPSSGFASTKTGALMGTAYFMSPEQTMGLRTVDHRTDLWALGVVTYLALTGIRPFEGETIGQLVIAITHGSIAPLASHHPALAPLDPWMTRALARDPNARFPSAKDLAESFTAAVAAMRTSSGSGHPVSALAETMPLPTRESGAPTAVPPEVRSPLGLTTLSAAVASGIEETGPVVAKRRLSPSVALAAAGMVVLGMAWHGLRQGSTQSIPIEPSHAPSAASVSPAKETGTERLELVPLAAASATPLGGTDAGAGASQLPPSTRVDRSRPAAPAVTAPTVAKSTTLERPAAAADPPPRAELPPAPTPTSDQNHLIMRPQ